MNLSIEREEVPSFIHFQVQALQRVNLIIHRPSAAGAQASFEGLHRLHMTPSPRTVFRGAEYVTLE